MKLSMIPIPCDTWQEAKRLYDELYDRDVICATRSDRAVLCAEDGQDYVLIYTGNLLGMIADLQDSRII